MNNNSKKVHIVGGGISGLITATVLEKYNINSLIIEQSDTLGGRIKTDIFNQYQLDHGFQVLLSSYEAAKKYLDILENEGKAGWGIRLTEKPSGCNGFEYLLDFSEKANTDDKVVVSQGLEIHMQKESFPRLKGSHIDYIDGLQGAGFKISNPNVRSSCHCGSSHGY